MVKINPPPQFSTTISIKFLQQNFQFPSTDERGQGDGGGFPPPLSAILEIPGQWQAGTCIESVMVLVQSTQHNFPFRFSFWYIDMS